MRTYDLSPLYRSTVGFDRFANMLDQVLTGDAAQPSYPPYNIEKVSDDSYRITLAVAGFGRDDIDIEAREGVLVVKGAHQAQGEDAQPTCIVASPSARLNAASNWPIMFVQQGPTSSTAYSISN